MGSDRALGVIQSFREILKDPKAAARAWKAQGGKVVGYKGLYVPEELIWAAGMLPYPTFGNTDPTVLANAYFQPCSCEYVRNIFDQALGGDLEFLDFLALTNTCDATRRLFDNWNRYIEHCPVHVINNPQKLLTDANHDYYLEELNRFKEKMELLSGEKISDAKLFEAIALYNETRMLLKQLYETRKQDPPPISGEEAFDVSMAAIGMPKAQANPLLRELLDALKDRDVPENFGTRILVTGSTIDHSALIRIIEEEGGQVVMDDLWTTSKYFWDQVEPGDDPMEALYEFLNRRVLSPCFHPVEPRFEHIETLIDEFDVEAVIDFNLKYCHPYMLEAPILKESLEARDIPTNVLEIGHDLSGHGQLRTRIQAFLEMIEL